ncbi:MAG: 23S rRNA (adenine(2503)-C(2))-methyltransferase RlmN [Bradymonadales bacterium]|nr:MAG: 23S rRNA (adenine(2503)-C(2))-methyltransferase RlmN [Bradymonadales bacterium]
MNEALKFPEPQGSVLEQPWLFFDEEIEAAEERLLAFGVKNYHAKSFTHFVYQLGVLEPSKMLSLSRDFRKRLQDCVDTRLLPIKKRLVSKDGTVKFLFEVRGPKSLEEIEAVYIPEKSRVTLCVSSQVGCKMGCRFCLTAQLGFRANLSAGDIVRQVMTVNADPELRPVTNIVFMGMGEPFDNLDEVRKATKILTHERGLKLSARKICVSTVGLADRIDSLTKEEPFRLAVSLNSSDDVSRNEVMPINRRWNLERLLESCLRYSQRTNKKVTFEYILMKGVTDRDEDLRNLVRLLSPIPCKLNLIPYNESPFTPFKRPTEERILEFHAGLLKAQFPVFIRKNRGNDIFAACGMLKRVDPQSSVIPEA